MGLVDSSLRYMEAWVEAFGFMLARCRTEVLPIVAREVADGGGGGRDILVFFENSCWIWEWDW